MLFIATERVTYKERGQDWEEPNRAQFLSQTRRDPRRDDTRESEARPRERSANQLLHMEQARRLADPLLGPSPTSSTEDLAPAARTPDLRLEHSRRRSPLADLADLAVEAPPVERRAASEFSVVTPKSNPRDRRVTAAPRSARHTTFTGHPRGGDAAPLSLWISGALWVWRRRRNASRARHARGGRGDRRADNGRGA